MPTNVSTFQKDMSEKPFPDKKKIATIATTAALIKKLPLPQPHALWKPAARAENVSFCSTEKSGS